MEYPISRRNNKKTTDISGGAGVIMRDIAIGLRKQGHHVHIVARGINDSEDHSFTDNGVIVHKITPSHYVSLTIKVTKFVQHLIDSEGIEIVESFDYAPLVCEPFKQVPFLIRMQTSYAYLQYVAGKINSPYDVKDKRYSHFSYSLHLADSIAASSQYILSEQSSFHSIPEEKIYGVINNGISLKVKKGKMTDTNTMFCHGTIRKGKGTDRLCKIFNVVSKLNQNVKLCIIGNGKTYWEKQCLPIIHSGMKHRVEFVPYSNREDTLKKISNCGIYISMSEHEAMSISMLEAMTLGKPLVLLKNGSFEEFIDDGVNGFIVNDEEEAAVRILALLQDRELYNLISHNARMKSRTYTMESCIEGTERWYQYVLRNNNRIQMARDRPYAELVKQYYLTLNNIV
ncbi:MAG: glycosyltransferase family 4 protein [Bacteroidetes bacterium]|nr:glycosyltransferase family 4 protein [Bacteroidota bacterium]